MGMVEVLHRCTMGTYADSEEHILGKYGDLFCPSSLISIDVYIVKGDGGLFETGLMKLFDLFKFVIKDDRVWTHTDPLSVFRSFAYRMSNNWISEQGLLIFDCLTEPLAQIAGLSMRFSSIYRLDDKVYFFFQGKLPCSKFLEYTIWDAKSGNLIWCYLGPQHCVPIVGISSFLFGKKCSWTPLKVGLNFSNLETLGNKFGWVACIWWHNCGGNKGDIW